MHIEFEDIQAVDDKVIFHIGRKCCKNFNQREITHTHCYGSFILHSILSQQTQMPSFKSIRLEITKLCSGLRTILKNFLIVGQENSSCSGLITPIIKLIRDLRVIYIYVF